MGIPSRWSGYGYYGALICLGLSFFMPMLLRFGKSLLSKEKLDYRPRSRYGLFTRCVALLMAGVFLIGVDSVRNLAEGTVSYSQLSTLQWAKGGTTITYDYDDNGSLISKVSTGTTTETVTYKYNLQNRLQRVETTPSGGPTQVVEYVYNDAGIRVCKIEDPDGTPIVTTYLVNSYNPTGYAQVIEEITDDDGTITRRTYTIGDDVIAQSDTPGTAAATEYLLYDGHGSTRQLSDSSSNITDCYSYDAYGVMLGGNPTTSNPATTNLLYSGEQFDNNLQQYYLRARYYDQNNGRFNRIDPYSGNQQDPQSLHKYLYAHANPCNYIDPSGRMAISTIVTIGIIGLLASIILFPQMWARIGSYSINKTTSPKNVAVVDGKLGFGHEWTFGWSGFNIREYSNELQVAGHNVTYSMQPDEEEFINILNSNEFVIVAAHGIDIWDLVAPGNMLDSKKKIFTGMKLGGTSSHPYDSNVTDTITDWSITPNDSWITANELDGRVSNSQLELIGIVCQLGKTKRIQQAISPGVFIGSDANIRGAQGRDLLGYATDRINGVSRNIAFRGLQSTGSHYVLYP